MTIGGEGTGQYYKYFFLIDKEAVFYTAGYVKYLNLFCINSTLRV